MARTPRSPHWTSAYVAEHQAETATRLAELIGTHTTSLSRLLPPIVQLALRIQRDLEGLWWVHRVECELDILLVNWQRAIADSLPNRSSSKPIVTAQGAVFAAMYLHYIPLTLDLPSTVEVVATEFPSLTWDHLLKVIPHAFPLVAEPPPKYPTDEFPLEIGDTEWNHRKLLRLVHVEREKVRIERLAKVNHNLVRRSLHAAHAQKLSPGRLANWLKAKAPELKRESNDYAPFTGESRSDLPLFDCLSPTQDDAPPLAPLGDSLKAERIDE